MGQSGGQATGKESGQEMPEACTSRMAVGREKSEHSWEVSGHQGSEELETEQSLQLERQETSQGLVPGTSTCGSRRWHYPGVCRDPEAPPTPSLITCSLPLLPSSHPFCSPDTLNPFPPGGLSTCCRLPCKAFLWTP